METSVFVNKDFFMSVQLHQMEESDSLRKTNFSEFNAVFLTAGGLCHSKNKTHYPLFLFTRKSGGDNIVWICDCRHGESNHCVDLSL